MTPYTLYHADCLDVLPTLEPQSVDAIICDPPYGTTACTWDSVIPFAPMWAGIKRVLRPRGACVLFGSQPFTSALVMSNVGWFREEIIWEKDNPTNFAAAKFVTMKCHENIILFAKNRYTYIPQMQDIGKIANKGGRGSRWRESGIHGKMGLKVMINRNETTRYPRTVIRYARPKHNSEGALHPTQKPLALLEYLVKTYTNAGDCVLDFTMGSGTTGHACGNLDRRFVGIEKDEAYYAIAEERIATAYAPLRHMQVAS